MAPTPERRRPLAVVPTAGMTREQMKAAARAALAEHLRPKADDSEADSQG